jgi:hypothetical protein
MGGRMLGGEVSHSGVEVCHPGMKFKFVKEWQCV